MKGLFPCRFQGSRCYPLDTPNQVAEVACKHFFNLKDLLLKEKDSILLPIRGLT